MEMRSWRWKNEFESSDKQDNIDVVELKCEYETAAEA
jgi:hypothetical protein